MNAFESFSAIEFDGRCDVDLRYDGDIRRVEDRRVFQRLIFALRSRHQHQAKILAKVVAGGANKIAHIFDEQEVEGAKIPSVQRVFNHLSFEMTNGSGRDLFDGRV